jgi:hypothetical protein
LGTAFTAELLYSSLRARKPVKRAQTLLAVDQMKRMSQGYATSTTDAAGNDMYVIAGAGVTDVNGWYRLKVSEADAKADAEAAAAAAAAAANGVQGDSRGNGKEQKKPVRKRGKLVYVRNVQVAAAGGKGGSARAKLLNMGMSMGVGASGWKKRTAQLSAMAAAAKTSSEPEVQLVEITLTREPGVGWVIRRGTVELYVNATDSNQPPASYWSSVDGGVGSSKTDPPPKIYNVTKLAISRTPAQRVRQSRSFHVAFLGAGNVSRFGCLVRFLFGSDSLPCASVAMSLWLPCRFGSA